MSKSSKTMNHDNRPSSKERTSTAAAKTKIQKSFSPEAILPSNAAKISVGIPLKKRAKAIGKKPSAPVAPPVVNNPPKATTLTNFSSNWQALKQVVGASGTGRKRKAERQPEEKEATKLLEAKGKSTGVTKVIAMDCEMVGVGPGGSRSALARVCIVNDDGNAILDAYVKPKEKVTDYRTWVSGIKPEHLRGDGVLTLEEVQEKVAVMLSGATLVGHSLNNDLKALLLDHPRKDTRDTGKYPPLMRSPAPGRKPRPRALRHLAKEELGLVIQEGEHSPVDDARAALYIYHKHRKDWERALSTGSLYRNVAKEEAKRKAIRESLGDKASTGAAARKARMGRGKGQLRIAQELEAKSKGKLHPFERDIKDDPYADL
ncbi:hypothetical protein CEUSTIGMA_g1042.t1 [Chlamydomonas eustigma]|uniref:RNA exonuclease 4 n=1 Tax=Chlamydomonas eustigma TaxID=1157962 RepID=A0A250WS28_9CHLO|nr:hypothetical protein CEUSTIGMA_g1042.t1 [Chlamydomonas eustigma]|eukprot:GAX73591.1 hypothetical protein CEUSTIGMA_g1042.t1 [Chlamydomonas eustigma]